MNKILLPFLVLLVFSMGIVSNVEQSSGAQNLESLIIIAKNAQTHIKSDLNKIENISPQILSLYGDTTAEFEKLASSVEHNDVSSAREQFVSVMTKLKQISYYLAKEESQKLQPKGLPDQIYVIERFETNVSKIKTIAINLNVDVGVGELESLLSLAKSNYAKGDSEKTDQTLEKLATKGLDAYNTLNEINKQNQIIRAKMFVEKFMPQINNLISIAKNQQLKQTLEKLEQSKLQLVSATDTQQIKSNMKMVLVLKDQVEADDPASLKSQKIILESKLQSLNQKAILLSNEPSEKKAVDYWLKRAFSLIDYTESLIERGAFQSAHKQIEQIETVLMNVEKLIYSST